ncbi:terminase [Salinicola corii]|uniref:Terminase n=1 Tax=Salinicola corii TaxID=2606937 RepID=A0A640WJM1_9GAMM|nr:terminase [Salinicola corii]KAA0020731.1 terminase [Salinicola corii]
MSPAEYERMLAEDMGRLADDPMGWVMYAFDWENDESIQKARLVEPWASRYDSEWGPDEWACEMLDDWGEHIRRVAFNGSTPVDPFQHATSSGHGIGKSAGSSWIILFIMSTRPFSKGVVTANTGDQLKTKTWSELAKWRSKCITGHWFNLGSGKGSLAMTHKDHPERWRVDALTCREENSEAFAGLHCADSSPWYLFDEASNVPDKIWEVAEGGLTDGEPFWFVFGNPTRNTGRFRECWRRFRSRWKTQKVDSRSVQVTNKDDIERKLQDYGEDSDYFRVRVRGEFPSSSDNQFIGQNLVDAGMAVQLVERQIEHSAIIIGVDPAFSGSDDAVIYVRQGLHSRMLGTWAKTDDDVLMAERIARFEDELGADAVHIDYGYGTGIYSVGKSWGRKWKLVNFGGASSDPAMLNKRGEMYASVKQWLKDGGQLTDQQTADELTWPEYTVRQKDSRIVLESKEDIRKRLVASPNRSDALVLTFAFPVVPRKGASVLSNHQEVAIADFDPFA